MKVKFIISSLALLLLACSENNRSFKVKFEGDVAEKKWSIKELNPDLPSDWSPYNYLTFDFRSSSTQRFNIVVHDAEGLRFLTIQPFQGALVRASIPLIHFRKRNTRGNDLAAISKTAMPGYWLGFSSAVGSISQVDTLSVIMQQPINAPTFMLSNVRLTMEPEDSILSPVPLVDEFGQWIPAEWPGKVRTSDELTAAWSEEDKNAEKTDYKVSKYGGYLDTRVKATGYFRVEKINDRWWLVDPEGYLFFSTGCCAVIPGGSFSRIEGREYIFAAFPPEELTLSDKRIGNAAFYSWNLYRRYGHEWYEKWIDMTIKRMNSWGLNTVDNWLDPAIIFKNRKTYTVKLGGWGYDARTMGLPDIYDPDYVSRVETSAKERCAPLKNDPYLLGYFVGNEPAWPGREAELVNVILEGEDTPMKSALETYLLEGDNTERRKAFIYDTYTRSTKIVNSAIRKYDPNHLNLGLRFGSSPPIDLIKASASIGFDVFSINVYAVSPDMARLNNIYDNTGMPIIIGEFHFGVPGRDWRPD
jgi:hypothetical protein